MFNRHQNHDVMAYVIADSMNYSGNVITVEDIKAMFALPDSYHAVINPEFDLSMGRQIYQMFLPRLNKFFMLAADEFFRLPADEQTKFTVNNAVTSAEATPALHLLISIAWLRHTDKDYDEHARIHVSNAGFATIKFTDVDRDDVGRVERVIRSFSAQTFLPMSRETNMHFDGIIHLLGSILQDSKELREGGGFGMGERRINTDVWFKLMQPYYDIATLVDNFTLTFSKKSS